MKLRGKGRWRPQRLAMVAVIMVWSQSRNLIQRFLEAAGLLGEAKGWSLPTSYSGFTEALAAEGQRLTSGVKAQLQLSLQKHSRTFWQRHGFTAFAIDGTRIEAPHTTKNEQGLKIAGRQKSAPQVALTLLYHLGTGLPWDYRLGPGTDGERTHARQFIEDLPAQSLIVGDAGFVGYELMRALLLKGHSFLIRAGKNVTLLTKLGWLVEERDDTVYLWPTLHRQGKPLVLRIIYLEHRQHNRNRRVALLTNILDATELSLDTAQELYALRWGEEVFFRSFKQTLERHTLRSRTAENCLREAEWAVLSLWLLGLLSVTRLIEAGHDPLEWSVAASRDIVRVALYQPHKKPHPQHKQRRHRHTLDYQFRRALKDTYKRTGPKKARNYPRKKQEQPPGTPITQSAPQSLIDRAKSLPPPNIPKHWTA